MTSRAFWPWRMTTMPDTTSPVAVQVRTPRRRSGPEDDLPMSLTRIGVPRLARGNDDVLEILDGPGVAPAADHVFGPAELDQPAARLDVAAADRLDHAA